MSKVGMVAQDFKPSIWEADVGRSLSLRLAQSIYRASSRISRTTQRNPIWNRPPGGVWWWVGGGGWVWVGGGGGGDTYWSYTLSFR